MKKLLAAICAALMMVSLSGCSDASADVTNGKDVLFTVGNEEITNADLYHPMLLSAGYSIVNELVTNAIYEKEVPVNDDITKAAQEILEKNKTAQGDNWEAILTQNRYKNEEDYYTKVALPNAQLTALMKIFLTDNAQEQIETYKPVKARIIACTSEDNAKKALAAVQGDTSFEDAAKDFGKTDTYKGDEIIVNQSSSLPSAVWSKISVISDKEAMINEVIVDTTTEEENPVYYVVKVTNTSALEEFKDEAIQSILDRSSTVRTDTMEFYLKKYNFHVYDIDIYNIYKSNNPKYLVQDAK